MTSWTLPPNQLVITATDYFVYNLTRNGFGDTFWKVIVTASYGTTYYIKGAMQTDPLSQITAAITSSDTAPPTLKYAFVGSRISANPLVFGTFPEWGTARSFAFTEKFIVVTPWVSRTVWIYSRPSETSANNTKVAQLQMPSFGINSVFQDGDSLYIISGGSAVNNQDILQVLVYSTSTWSLVASFPLSCPVNCPLSKVIFGGLSAVDKSNRIMLLGVSIGSIVSNSSNAVVRLNY